MVAAWNLGSGGGDGEKWGDQGDRNKTRLLVGFGSYPPLRSLAHALGGC